MTVAQGVARQRKLPLHSPDETGTATASQSSAFSSLVMVRKLNRNIRGKPGNVWECERGSLVDTMENITLRERLISLPLYVSSHIDCHH